jgi:starvation-inducible DNA-binding protein
VSDSTDTAGNSENALPGNLGREARRLLTASLNRLIADLYALELRTLDSRGLASGLHSPGVRRLLEKHASAMHASARKLIDRVCSMGGHVPSTLSDLASHERVASVRASHTENPEYLLILLENNQQFGEHLREVYAHFELNGDVTGARLIADMLERTEHRSIELFQLLPGN